MGKIDLNSLHNIIVQEKKRREKLFGLKEIDINLFGKPQGSLDLIGMKEQIINVLEESKYSLEDRLDWVDKISFITTKSLEKLYKKLDSIRKGINTAPNLRIVGDSRMGKSCAVQYYSMLINQEYGNDNLHVGPVLCIEVPSHRSNILDFYRYGCLWLGEFVNGPEADLRVRFANACHKNGIQMLIVDEAAHIDNTQKRESFKTFQNMFGKPIVTVSADNLFGSDSQLKGRFSAKHDFGNYSNEELETIVDIFESYLPMKDFSDLTEWEIEVSSTEIIPGPIKLLQEWTRGNIFHVHTLLKMAAKIALQKGEDIITIGDLKEAKEELMLDEAA